MNILVTGVTGFAGSHLIKYLRSELDDRCIGLSRSVKNKDDAISCDLTDIGQVDTAIKQTSPDLVFHMAGSFTNNFDTDFRSNVLCAKNLLDSIAKNNVSARILLMGSAAEYGEVANEDNPVSEQMPLKPISVYGWTKAAQSMLALLYSRSNDMEVMVARTFNLLGKGMSDKLFTGHVEKQIKAARSGEQDRISVGCLDAQRDYIDINEACPMYLSIAQHGKAGEAYNVGSGNPTAMRDLLQKMLENSNLDMTIVDEDTSNNSKQHKEVSIIYADMDKTRQLM